MLNDDKKSLIEAEERYRHEIASKLRSELSAAGQEMLNLERTIWDKINEVLNSNVGMWFLSTVLVTGGAGAYQMMQHHYEVKMHNRTQLITHQFEIGNRIQNMKYFLRKAQTVGDAQFALKSVFQSKTPINPDVEKLSLSVLYFNLYQVEGAQNKETLDLVRQLEDQYYILQSQKPSDPLPPEQKAQLLKLVDELEAIQIKEGHKG
jgi:hypothetical protein